MPERERTERHTRGDQWRATVQEALTRNDLTRSAVPRIADAAMSLADEEARADRVKLRDLRILLERQRDDATALMRRALSEGVQHHRATALREAALEGLRILEREP